MSVHILLRGPRMGATDFTAQLTSILRQWDGVETLPHRFGGIEFRLGTREIGHLHLGGVADLLVSVRLRRDLVAAGRASAHRTLPHSGWISFRVRSEHDLPALVALFRLNYERLRGTAVRPTASPWLGTPRLLGDRTADDLPA